MKKLLIALMACLGIAFGFTSCDKNNDPKPENKEKTTEATPDADGKALYDSFVSFQNADSESTEGKAAKVIAAAKMIDSYNSFKTNKDDKEYCKEFASAAVSTLAAEKKEEAKTALLTKLESGDLIDTNTVDKVGAVASFVTELSKIFGATAK